MSLLGAVHLDTRTRYASATLQASIRKDTLPVHTRLRQPDQPATTVLQGPSMNMTNYSVSVSIVTPKRGRTGRGRDGPSGSVRQRVAQLPRSW